MIVSLLNHFSILVQLFIFVTNHCVLTAIADRLRDNRLNSVYDFNINHGFDKYDKSDKCEINIVTSGVCSVNNHLVKPAIFIKHSSRVKQIPVYSRPRNDERVRNMNSFKFEEKKANQLVDEFLVKFKDHFGPKIDPMLIRDFGSFRLKKVGDIRIYELSLKGISNMKRSGPIRLHSDSKMKLWLINTNLTIDNITADFKVDAELKNRVFIKGWTLQVLIRKCLLNAVIEFDASTKMMTISSLMVSTIEGFNLNSENLSWPFSQVVHHIINYQMNDLKSVISSNAQKYLSETLRTFDVSNIFDNMTERTINMRD